MGVYIVMILIGLVIGVGLTVIVSRIMSRKKSIGSLCVDDSDPDDGPYLFLEFKPDQSPEAIMRKSYVTLKVNIKHYVSHK